MKSALVIFVRNPVIGEVKTRLAKVLGDTKALEVYIQLLNHTHSITANIQANKFVFYVDHINEDDLWESYLYKKRLQSGITLGERMKNAFEYLFAEGYRKVIIIGSDCYELTQVLIEDAFNQLTNIDTAIGPAKDGGYYLLGMNTFIPHVFENKTWSTSTVFADTMKDITDENYSCYLLPCLRDIDTADDLREYNELIT